MVSSENDQRRDPTLEASLGTTWDARVVDYDPERFPFAERIRDEVVRLGHRVDSLERLHEVVPREEVYRLSKQLCDATHEPSFRRMVHDFIHDEVAPKGELTPPLVVQRFLNVRIMLPDKPQGVFPFHTGLLYGHGDASRSLWMPLTDVTAPEDRSASMQIIDLEQSRELTQYATENELTVDEMTETFGRASHGVEAGPGDVLLFTQEHIHGNFVNRTGKTRVSIDFRVAEGRFGDRLARKIPGGYFELIPERGEEAYRPDHQALANGKANVIYLNNNTTSTEGVPVHLQRYMVYDYCHKHDLPYEFELFELETMNHLPTLRHVVDGLGCNALMYSIYALPECAEHRKSILDAVQRAEVQLFFANEGLVLASDEDRARIEGLLEFAKYGEAVTNDA